MTLWPKGAPGEKGNIGAEVDTTKPDQDPAGKRVIRLGNVTNPTLTVYKPAASKDTGAAVVVFPGGGYSILAMDLEGTEICEWFNSIGVTGILVKYRVPAQPDSPRGGAPLQDAQRAMRLARAHASEWHINPARIGVMGFSAGGHLAALVSNNFNKPMYEPIDAADQSSARPDFTILIYPAYLTGRQRDDYGLAGTARVGQDSAHNSDPGRGRSDSGGRQPGVLPGFEERQSARRDASLSRRRARLWAAFPGGSAKRLAQAGGRVDAFDGAVEEVIRKAF